MIDGRLACDLKRLSSSASRASPSTVYRSRPRERVHRRLGATVWPVTPAEDARIAAQAVMQFLQTKQSNGTDADAVDTEFAAAQTRHQQDDVKRLVAMEAEKPTSGRIKCSKRSAVNYGAGGDGVTKT
jgi:hypothetical protein